MKLFGNQRTGVLIIMLFACLVLQASDLEKVSFRLFINKVPTSLNRIFCTVLPGKSINFKLEETGNNRFEFIAAIGHISNTAEFSWVYQAPPEPGTYELILQQNGAGERVIITVFVLVPADRKEGEYLNGYRIGNYPEKLFRNNTAYKKPEGFIEVTELNENLYLTPHFQLKQFLCKQQPESEKKYIVLQPKLLIKLELLIEELNLSKINTNQLFVMSGYRTPFYNASIGNGKFSRHIYGDAADVYIDNDMDGVIDDLNKDGVNSMKDAILMYSKVEEIEKNYPYLVGGLGKYNKTSAHTWNIHTDTRGYRARW